MNLSGSSEPLADSSFCSAESESVSDVLREDPRPPVLHGGAVGRGHEDLDGRDRHRGGGLHAVHELKRRRARRTEGTPTPCTEPNVNCRTSQSLSMLPKGDLVLFSIFFVSGFCTLTEKMPKRVYAMFGPDRHQRRLRRSTRFRVKPDRRTHHSVMNHSSSLLSVRRAGGLRTEPVKGFFKGDLKNYPAIVPVPDRKSLKGRGEGQHHQWEDFQYQLEEP